jgi:hypothetical protein
MDDANEDRNRSSLRSGENPFRCSHSDQPLTIEQIIQLSEVQIESHKAGTGENRFTTRYIPIGMIVCSTYPLKGETAPYSPACPSLAGRGLHHPSSFDVRYFFAELLAHPA